MMGEELRSQGGGPVVGRIAVGSAVRWSSQSAGTTKVKVGRVLAFVPRWSKPPLPPAYNSQLRTGFGTGSASTDRYLVEVPRKGRRGDLPPLYYSPLASVLEKQNPQAERTP